MSRSFGAGQPLRFHCAKCRARFSEQAAWIVTGRMRDRFGGHGGRSDALRQYEYRCEGCGHTGWSRHMDVARRWCFWKTELQKK